MNRKRIIFQIRSFSIFCFCQFHVGLNLKRLKVIFGGIALWFSLSKMCQPVYIKIIFDDRSLWFLALRELSDTSMKKNKTSFHSPLLISVRKFLWDHKTKQNKAEHHLCKTLFHSSNFLSIHRNKNSLKKYHYSQWQMYF